MKTPNRFFQPESTTEDFLYKLFCASSSLFSDKLENSRKVFGIDHIGTSQTGKITETSNGDLQKSPN